MLYWRYDDVNLVHHPIHEKNRQSKKRNTVFDISQ